MQNSVGGILKKQRSAAVVITNRITSNKLCASCISAARCRFFFPGCFDNERFKNKMLLRLLGVIRSLSTLAALLCFDKVRPDVSMKPRIVQALQGSYLLVELCISL